MSETSRDEKVSLLASGLTAIAMVVELLLWRRTGLLSLGGLLPLLLFTLGTSITVYFRSRMFRQAEEERREDALARKEAPANSLFSLQTGEDFSPFTSGRALLQFEKWLLPAIPWLFAALLGGSAWWLWRAAGQAQAAPSNPLLAAAFLGGQAFFLFLLSRYQIGLAREASGALHRGPGVAMGLLSVACAGVAVVAVAINGGATQADAVTARVLAGLCIVLAVEQLIWFVAALYSPRHRKPFSTAYESRLGRLVTDPASWTRGVARTLDYQFGFNVSDSWLYRFVRGALAPLVVFQLAALYLMSCFVFLGPDEEGVLEHFGRPVEGRWHLTSGFHTKMPWPFESVRRIHARRALSVDIGFEADTTTNRPPVLVWTIPHYRQEDLFVVPVGATQDVDSAVVPCSLIAVNIPVEYQITNLYQYVYTAQNPDQLLKQMATRAVTREAARRNMVDFLGPQREEVAAAIGAETQRAADLAGLGVEIRFVGIRSAHPPVQVADAFESVVGAYEEREAAILTAEAYTNRVVPAAVAEAERVRLEATSYSTRRSEMAQAEAVQFEKRRQAAAQSPSVFRKFSYLAALRDAIAGSRKYIVDAPQSREVLYFNLEEKAYADLFDIGTTPAGDISAGATNRNAHP